MRLTCGLKKVFCAATALTISWLGLAADVTVIVGSDGDAPIKTFVRKDGGDWCEYSGCYPSQGSVFPPDWIESVTLKGVVNALAKGAAPSRRSVELWDESSRCPINYTFYSNTIDVQVFCAKNYTGKERSHSWNISHYDKLTVRQLAVPRFQFLSHPKGVAEIGAGGGYLTVNLICNDTTQNPFKVNVSSYKGFVTCTSTPETMTPGVSYGFMLDVQPNTTGKARSAEVWFYNEANNPQMSKYLTIRQSADADGGSHEVTYLPGADGSGSQQKDTKIAGQVLKLRDAIFTRVLYTQDGWSKSDGGTRDYALGDSYSIEQSLTLYPHWKSMFGNRKTITYNSDSESSGKKIVISTGTDDVVSLLGSVFSKEDSVQNGWTTKDGTTTLKLGETYSGSESLSLFPIWTSSDSVATYTITYQPGAVGYGKSRTESHSGSGMVSLLATTFTRDGYEQSGWTTRDGGSKEYELGGNYAKATSITLYPSWNEQKKTRAFTVSFLPTSDAVGQKWSSTKLFDDSIVLPGKSFERLGFSQNGWSLSDGGEKKYELGGTYSANADVTLYPTWTADNSEFQRTITYCAATGSTSENIVDTVIGGVATGLRNSTFSLSGMKQTGWTTTAGGEKDFDLGESLNIVTSTKLYPTWAAAETVATLTYAPGEKGTGAECVTSASLGQTTVLRGALFTRSGYQQTGWSLTDGGIKAFNLGAICMPTGDMTLYPYWSDTSETKISTLTFSPGTLGSGFVTTIVQPSGTAVSLLGAQFKRKGYVQTGWSRTDGGSQEFSLGEAFGRNANATFYPTWTKEETASVYMISYQPGDAVVGSAVKLVKKAGEKIKLSGALFFRVGYAQTGWSKSVGGDKAYDLGADYETDAPLTLYPYWTGNADSQLTTLLCNPGINGSGMVLNLTVNSLGSTQIPTFTFSRTGYLQDGWSLSDGGDKAFNLGAAVNDIDVQTLFPHWTPVSKEVNWIRYYGGTNSMIGGSTLTEKAKGSTIVLNGGGCICKDFRMKQTGWATREDGPLVYELGEVYAEDHDLSLYPHWELNPARMQFCVFYSAGSYGTLPAIYGSGTMLVDSNFGAPVAKLRGDIYTSLRKGWFQTGWQDAAGNFYSLNGAGPTNFTANLTPFWTYDPSRATYQIAFDANKGSGKMTNVTVSCEDAFQLPTNEFVRDGYRFLGWSLKSTGSWTYGDEGMFSQGVSAQGSTIRLYAQWIADGCYEYRIQPNADGETAKLVGVHPLPSSDLVLTNRVYQDGKWYRVTEIGAYAFSGSMITALELPSSVERLESNALTGCEGLRSVRLANPNVVVDSRAFSDVYTLESVALAMLDGYDFLGWQTDAGDVYSPDVSVFMLGLGADGNSFSIHGYFRRRDSASVPAGCSCSVMYSEYAGWSVKGLPSGLKWNKTTGTITGSPTSCGSFTLTFTKGKSAEKRVFRVSNFVDELIPVDDVYGPWIPGVRIVQSIPAALGCSAKGLPAGLNWKNGVLSGSPTKPGTNTVVFTKTVDKVKHTASATIIVDAYRAVSVAIVGAGRVAGTGGYVVGKKVTLKATANKGNVFRGWYAGTVSVSGETEILALPEPISTFATYTIDSMPANDVALTAVFISSDCDRANIAARVNGMPLAPWVSKSETCALSTNILAGVYLEWPVAASALSETTVKVSGLPSGLKFNAKENKICGAPSSASKAAKGGAVTPSAIKLTVTTAGKNSQTYQLDVIVDPLPSWAVGTFTGPSRDGDSTNGLATVTIASSGKISAKQPVNGKSANFAASCFDGYAPDDQAFYATLTAKVGKQVVTNELMVSPAEIDLSESTFVTNGLIAADRFDAWQYNWKIAPWKALVKPLDRSVKVYYVDDAGQMIDEYAVAPTLGADDVVGKVTLKFSASGSVTATGEFVTGYDEKKKKFTTVKATSSTTLVPSAEGNLVFVYLAPNPAKKFSGHIRCVVVE